MVVFKNSICLDIFHIIIKIKKEKKDLYNKCINNIKIKKIFLMLLFELKFVI